MRLFYKSRNNQGITRVKFVIKVMSAYFNYSHVFPHDTNEILTLDQVC